MGIRHFRRHGLRVPREAEEMVGWDHGGGFSVHVGVRIEATDRDGMLKRLHLPTVRRLYTELEQRAETEEMSYRDYLAILIAEEGAHRAQTRVQRSVRRAKFPFVAPIEDFDFTFQSSVRLQLLGSFLGPELVTEGRSLILSGPTGTGKTRLAISIAYRAIQNGYEARFATAAELIETLSNAARGGQLAQALHDFTHPHVLVIDEVGYLSLRDNAANVLFQVVNERYLEGKPMLFTTNKPLAAWGHVLHDPDLAEALLEPGPRVRPPHPAPWLQLPHTSAPKKGEKLRQLLHHPWCHNFRNSGARISGTHRLAYWVDDAALQHLKTEVFGKWIVVTNRDEWSTEDIILAYRGQSRVEAVFRQLEDDEHLALRPQYPWTDQKIHVHAFICQLTLLLTRMVEHQGQPWTPGRVIYPS